MIGLFDVVSIRDVQILFAKSIQVLVPGFEPGSAG